MGLAVSASKSSPAGLPGLVPVHGSKDSDGPALHFPADAFSSFVSAVKRGRFPTP
jgi:hypothetical protein